MLTQTKYHLLEDFFNSRDQFHFAYLFGSQAKGTSRSESDVDIAIFPVKAFSAQDRLKLKSELERLVNADVDLVILPDVSLILRFEMLKSGKLIVAQDRAFFQRYVMHTMGLYFDFKTERAPIERRMIERIQHGR